MKSKLKQARLVSLIAMSVAGVGRAAEYAPFYEGPGFDPVSKNGYKMLLYTNPFHARLVNTRGLSTDPMAKYVGNQIFGTQASAYDALGPKTFDYFGTDFSGKTNSISKWVTDEGYIYGQCQKYVSNTLQGYVGARWNPDGSIVEYVPLSTNATGFSSTTIHWGAATGQALGASHLFVNGSSRGVRAAYWSNPSTIVELQNPFTFATNFPITDRAVAMNSSGTITGVVDRYDEPKAGSTPTRAMRWNQQGHGTVLPSIGTEPTGAKYSTAAYDINESGDIIGQAMLWSGETGSRVAVRWDASDVPHELPALAPTGATAAIDINNLGQVLGTSTRENVFNNNSETKAVRWDAHNQITELGHLGISYFGTYIEGPSSMNESGQCVGWAYPTGSMTQAAVYWKGDGTCLNLNTLLSSNTNWYLNYANTITDNGWVTGVGTYDPDGGGPIASYNRAFTMNISTSNAWSSGSNGIWNDGPNWGNYVSPYSAVDAYFQNAESRTVGFTASSTAHNLSVSGGDTRLVPGSYSLQLNGNLNVSGGTLRIQGALTLGTAANGKVGVNGMINLTGGTLQAPSLNLSTAPGALKWTAGTLNLGTGSITGLSTLIIPASGILSGNGAINANLTVNGKLAPGNSPGQLTVNGTLDFNTGSTLAVDVNGLAAGTEYDQMIVNGVVDLAGASLMIDLGSFVPSSGQSFMLIDNDGVDPVTGRFTNATDTGLGYDRITVGTTDFNLDYTGGSGNDVVLTVVPEPTCISLIAAGSIGLLRRRRRGNG